MAEAGSGGEDDERQSSRDDKFAEETETIFKGFMFHRLTSQIEQEATDGDMSVGQIPKPVLKEIENESSLLEKQTRNEQLLGKVTLICLRTLHRSRITKRHSKHGPKFVRFSIPGQKAQEDSPKVNPCFRKFLKYVPLTRL